MVRLDSPSRASLSRTNIRKILQKIAPLIDQQRVSLYEAEKAKGTDPVEILKKLFDFANSQPRSYREATGQVEEAWGLGSR
jgi:hypothetical protein